MELVYLTFIAVIFVAGLFVSVLSRKVGLPNIFFLIILGIIFGNLTYKGNPLIYFPQSFIITIGIFAIVLIVFQGSSMLKLKDFDAFSMKSLKLFFILLIFNTTAVTLACMLLFREHAIFIGILLGVTLTATASEVIMPMLQNKESGLIKILEIESLIDTPFIVLLSVMLLNTMQKLTADFSFVFQLSSFLQQIIIGLGSGIFIGIVVFKLLKRTYLTTFHKNLAQLGIIGAALLTYVIAENLHGSGILAVTALGVFFGNSFVKEKTELEGFSTLLSDFLSILVFIMVGLVIKISFNHIFFIKSLAIFIVYLASRMLACHLAFPKNTVKEKIFMTLESPKGIATATTVLVFASAAQFAGLDDLLNIALLAILYSIITSSVCSRFSGYFLVQKKSKEKA
ncbi:MAG: cation:proton antiporter [Candidatus Woesearchaeota archaeon]